MLVHICMVNMLISELIILYNITALTALQYCKVLKHHHFIIVLRRQNLLYQMISLQIKITQDTLISCVLKTTLL